MTDRPRQLEPAATRQRQTAGLLCRRRAAFTLVEWIVVMAIVAILFSIAGMAFRGAAASSVMAQAKNALVTYTQVARSYAVANHIETMLVVNPHNGRFEIWHLNPPVDGGPWDPQSGGDATVDPEKTDGYEFAPVLDPAARLPQTPMGKPAAIVNPIDYNQRPLNDDDRSYDNLTWAAFCFDEEGQLVIRTRRIATRTYLRRNGNLEPNPNRLEIDATPDLTLDTLVDGDDTPITSTRGFVISDAPLMMKALGGSFTPASLVNDWLLRTREGEYYRPFAETIVLNRFSGQQLTGAR
ncbi:MAG: prepilin-type N-terminal cleavage/methylation domain-containing protein [Planctomycetota bacterium]